MRGLGAGRTITLFDIHDTRVDPENDIADAIDGPPTVMERARAYLDRRHAAAGDAPTDWPMLAALFPRGFQTRQDYADYVVRWRPNLEPHDLAIVMLAVYGSRPNETGADAYNREREAMKKAKARALKKNASLSPANDLYVDKDIGGLRSAGRGSSSNTKR